MALTRLSTPLVLRCTPLLFPTVARTSKGFLLCEDDFKGGTGGSGDGGGLSFFEYKAKDSEDKEVRLFLGRGRSSSSWVSETVCREGFVGQVTASPVSRD